MGYEIRLIALFVYVGTGDQAGAGLCWLGRSPFFALGSVWGSIFVYLDALSPAVITIFKVSLKRIYFISLKLFTPLRKLLPR